jgi:hypothetical protein
MIIFKNLRNERRAVRPAEILKVVERKGYLSLVLRRGRMAAVEPFDEFVRRIGAEAAEAEAE